MTMFPKILLRSSLFFLLAFISVPPAHSSPDDYHPVTGEPKCANCHTPDRAYSIDYTRDDSCLECHGPGLSQEYISINDRFRSEEEPLRVVQAAAKDKGAGRSERYKDMVYVPPGEFTMGSNDWWPKSQPEHKRDLEGFYIDRYEVTNARFKPFVDSTGHLPPDHWSEGKVPDGRADHPVTFVSWSEAAEFCKWEGKRLPHEAEWEKAARGTDARTFPWGKEFSKYKANTPQYGHEDTMPVGSFPDGASPYGVHDMAGNAWEWVEEWFQPYPGNTHTDENYGEQYKVLRGGSWYDCTYYKCGISAPSFNKIFFNPHTRNNNFGFRCAKDAE